MTVDKALKTIIEKLDELDIELMQLRGEFGSLETRMVNKNVIDKEDAVEIN